MKLSLSSEIEVWKSEKYIFDILDYCSAEKRNSNNNYRASVISFSKNDCYAPLKNFEGKYSVSYVQEALYQKDRKILYNITGKEQPSIFFELAIDFHYPTDDIKSKWKGRVISKSSYVEP